LEIAFSGGELAVLDEGGSRVQVLDGDGKLVSRFLIGLDGHRNVLEEQGITIDKNGEIYVTRVGESTVRVYTPSGHLVSSFGQSGNREGQFSAPDGLWIDDNRRVYVADTHNRRVQVFQINTLEQQPNDGNQVAASLDNDK